MRLPILIVASLLLAACGEGQPDHPSPSSPGAPPAQRSAVSSSSAAPDQSARVLPDLRISPPLELYIQSGADGVKEIRFSTTIQNAGEGPLLMVGEYEEDSGAVSTIQLIDRTDGTTEEYNIGRFVFDDGHEHWHLEDFIVFELWSVAPDGKLDQALASTGKVTCCLADSHPMEEPPPNAASMAKVTSCEQTLQGISVGWEDIYLAALPGQELDIPGLADGRYAIRSVVDPDNLILETDNRNNATVRLVDIAGDTITYVS